MDWLIADITQSDAAYFKWKLERILDHRISSKLYIADFFRLSSLTSPTVVERVVVVLVKKSHIKVCVVTLFGSGHTVYNSPKENIVNN